MKKSKLENLLMENGWICEIKNNAQKWKRGDAILYLARDFNGKYFLQLSEDEWGYINGIYSIEFTPFRILIRWDNYQEWYITY